jgi:hypothetical protein
VQPVYVCFERPWECFPPFRRIVGGIPFVEGLDKSFRASEDEFDGITLVSATGETLATQL